MQDTAHYYLSLDEMRFFAHHGCSEEERAVGGNFVVSLRMTLKKSEALLSDEIGDTIDYAQVYNSVKGVMATPCKLIEHVAARILNELFSNYAELSALSVRVSKLHPPIEGAEIKSASAELYDER